MYGRVKSTKKLKMALFVRSLQSYTFGRFDTGTDFFFYCIFCTTYSLAYKITTSLSATRLRIGLVGWFNNYGMCLGCCGCHCYFTGREKETTNILLHPTYPSTLTIYCVFIYCFFFCTCYINSLYLCVWY